MSLIATQLPEDVFEHIAKNAGIVAKAFNTESWSVNRSDIAGATTGGIEFKDAPDYQDYGEDIDNCPKNTKELKEIVSRVITVAGTYVSVTKEEMKNMIAAADISGTKITPRDELTDEDFRELWFIVDYGVGGAIAIHLKDTLNTEGLSIKTSDKAKAQFSFSFMAHYSMTDPSEVPYEIYIKESAA